MINQYLTIKHSNTFLSSFLGTFKLTADSSSCSLGICRRPLSDDNRSVFPIPILFTIASSSSSARSPPHYRIYKLQISRTMSYGVLYFVSAFDKIIKFKKLYLNDLVWIKVDLTIYWACFLVDFHIDLLMDQFCQQWTICSSHQSNWSSSCPKQKCWPNVTIKK